MNHPDQQAWVDYLYGEPDPDTRSRLNDHAAQCAQCRSQLEAWQHARQHLDAWKLPTHPFSTPVRSAFSQLARWTAAALILIAFGFGIGRLAGPAPATIAALREELRTEMLGVIEARVAASGTAVAAVLRDETAVAMGRLIDFYQTERLADQQEIATAIARLDGTQAADFMALRKDLETVAVNSDLGLRQTRHELIRLADYSQAFTPMD
jgi:anti-sigma factor RsiW